jgi:hypothetical protein
MNCTFERGSSVKRYLLSGPPLRVKRHLFPGPLAGRPRESIHGSNACVRREARDGLTGLARSTDRAAQCCGKNFPDFRFPAASGKPMICRRGKSRSTYTSIGLRYPVAPKPSATIHGCPPNACVGPHVFDAPENKPRSTAGVHGKRCARDSRVGGAIEMPMGCW